MQLRPYQQEAVDGVFDQWEEFDKTLLVMVTGGGKTICFAKIAERCVSEGKRVLILAHRGELLDQAADKIFRSTGLKCSVEKADQTSIGEWYRITVGSIQTLMREKRLSKFHPDHYDVIIVDEAHHALSDSYLRVLNHFNSKVLGVTATPDRGDKRNLGQYFESLAYEYSLPTAIRDGFLVPIRAQTIPIKLDMTGVKKTAGDYQMAAVGNALDPFLEVIAEEISKRCGNYKTVIFTPLIATSKKLLGFLRARKMNVDEVNGDTPDRAQKLKRFDQTGNNSVMLNSMLLTEGWDCPSVSCVIVLRATKVTSLYCLDMDTEILTNKGWVGPESDIDLVASFNKESSEIQYSAPLAKVVRPLNSDEYFCSISGPSSDIRVTNKHRMLYDNKRKTGWKFTTAEHLAGLSSGAHIPVSGYRNNAEISAPLSDDELRFIGWVMTDGSINKITNAISISQGAHQPWLEEIQKCIDGCGFKHNRFIQKRNSQYKSNSDCIVWTISKGKPRGRDKHLRGWGALDEYLSKDFSEKLMDEISSRQFDVLLHAIHLGDGSKQSGQKWTRRSYHIATGNKVFADRLQILGVQNGYRSSIAEYGYNKNPLYFVHMKKTAFINIGSTHDSRPSWKKEEHSNENCWCVETNDGTLITRRNGKVAIVGNCQMVGRGTRLSPQTGKDHLLLLDFLWHSEKHDLCRPAHLICESDEVAQVMTENINESACGPIDLTEAVEVAEQDTIAKREEALAKQLEELRHKKAKLVDPLQYEMSIQSEDLASYVPAFGWETEAPSTDQKDKLAKLDINPLAVESAGKAQKIIDAVSARQEAGLATPKQIRFLENKGFQHVGKWDKTQAKGLVDRIAANRWRVPYGIDAKSYVPTK